MKPKVCVLRAAGTNCDIETAFAFSKAGAIAECVHINSIISRKKALKEYQILAIPGGFTYGDDIAAGKVLANELRFKLGGDIKQFLNEGKLIIGICNGFQILTKAGVLPGNGEFRQDADLFINDSGKFEDRWVYLKSPEPRAQSPECAWVKDLPKVIYLPVAHGEGKFIVKDNSILEKLRVGGRIVFQYCDESGRFSGYPYNPNGSQDNIAGICDDTGRVLGLMPHPERHIEFSQHPRWTKSKIKRQGDGLKIFKNGVRYAKRIL